MKALIVTMSGAYVKTSYAVWIGDRIDPDNPRRLIGARLLDTFSRRGAAFAAARDASEGGIE